jgi:hypothetical protein
MDVSDTLLELVATYEFAVAEDLVRPLLHRHLDRVRSQEELDEAVLSFVREALAWGLIQDRAKCVDGSCGPQ